MAVIILRVVLKIRSSSRKDDFIWMRCWRRRNLQRNREQLLGTAKMSPTQIVLLWAHGLRQYAGSLILSAKAEFKLIDGRKERKLMNSIPTAKSNVPDFQKKKTITIAPSYLLPYLLLLSCVRSNIRHVYISRETALDELCKQLMIIINGFWSVFCCLNNVGWDRVLLKISVGFFFSQNSSWVDSFCRHIQILGWVLYKGGIEFECKYLSALSRRWMWDWVRFENSLFLKKRHVLWNPIISAFQIFRTTSAQGKLVLCSAKWTSGTMRIFGWKKGQFLRSINVKGGNSPSENTRTLRNLS